MKDANKLIIYTDGGARGNPGPAGVGVCVKDEHNKVVYEFAGFLGTATNNEAEYQGFLASLKWLVKHQKNYPKAEIKWKLDSNLVVQQLNRNWKIKQPHLRKLATIAWDMLNNIALPYSITYVPRAENKEADALANRAMDQGI